MRSPFTGIVFALELTHDFNMLLPLVIAELPCPWVYGADAEAFDSDGEDLTPRLSLEP